MQKIILSTCLISTIFVACGDVGESYQVEKFGNSRISILYQGEGIGKILKVTANRGNCKVYDNNYRSYNFKNENTLVSGKESPKFCYSDINKKIGAFLSLHNDYTCSRLSYNLTKDLSSIEPIHIYRYTPYTKEQKDEFDSMAKIVNEFATMNLNDMVSKIAHIDTICVDSESDLIELFNAWEDNQEYGGCGYNYNKGIPPYMKLEFENIKGQMELVAKPLDDNEINIVQEVFSAVKKYKDLENIIQNYDSTQKFGIDSGHISRVYDSWQNNEAYHIYKPYNFLEPHKKLDKEEIDMIKKLEKELYYDYYVELKYGNKASFNVRDCSEILEVEITTDKGNATYKF